MLDASSSGALLCKSNTKGHALLESITTNTYQWMITRVTNSISQKDPTGVHEVTETIILVAQVAQIYQMMKTMLIPSNVSIVEPVKLSVTTISLLINPMGTWKLAIKMNLLNTFFLLHTPFSNTYAHSKKNQSWRVIEWWYRDHVVAYSEYSNQMAIWSSAPYDGTQKENFNLATAWIFYYTNDV